MKITISIDIAEGGPAEVKFDTPEGPGQDAGAAPAPGTTRSPHSGASGDTDAGSPGARSAPGGRDTSEADTQDAGPAPL